MQKLEELTSLKNQVKELHLQVKSRKQNFHGNSTNIYKPHGDTIKDTSRDITKTITETPIKNNKALPILNDNLLEIMTDRGILISYLLSSFSKITNPEHTSQYTLINDPDSERIRDLLIN